LGEALGFTEEELSKQPKLGMDALKLKEFVKGTNQRIPEASYITESCPAGCGSGFIYFDEPSPIFDYYQIEKNGVRFIGLGGHDDTDVGTTCYHKFTGTFGILLNHLIDGPNQYVVGDMCAGADPFASSGLASRFDAIFLIVEPTVKSITVYKQCREFADMFDIQLFVIGNKIENDSDIDFIKNTVGDDLIASLTKSDYIRDFEKGIVRPIDQLEDNNVGTLQTILDKTDSLTRDWKKYQETGLKFHKAAADGWADAIFGLDTMDFVDPYFSYDDLVSNKVQKAA
jgi:CO dehydrogenase maturation factor